MKQIEESLIAEIIQADLLTQTDALSELMPTDFTTQFCRDIFLEAANLVTNGRKADLITLSRAMPTKAKELSRISYFTVSETKIPEYIGLVKEHSFKRNLISKVEGILKSIKETQFHDEVIGLKEKLVLDISKIGVTDRTEFINVAGNIDKLIERIDSGHKDEGYSWGISEVDKMTSGIVIPRYYILGGLKKSGKTRFLINTIKNLHKQNVSIGFISLEMPQYELTKMLCSSFLKMDDMKLKAGGYISNTEKDELRGLRNQLNYRNLNIDCTASLNKEQVLQRIRLMSKLGCKVIFIDYIQRILHSIQKEAQEIEKISASIADASREYNVAVVALAQLNNLAESETPSIGHLKGSGGIAETADTIMLIDNLYRRNKSEENRGKFDVYFEQRYGDSGVKRIEGDLGSSCFGDYFNAPEFREVF